MDYPRDRPFLIALIDSREKELESLKKELNERNKLSVRDTVEVVYSLDKSSFYVRDGFNRPRAWLSTVVLTEEPTNSGAFGPGFVHITLSDGKSYYRKIWDFAWWSVKSGEKVKVKMPEKPSEITTESELVKDYVVTGVQNWQWEGWS